MDREMIHDVEVRAAHELPSSDAEPGDHPTRPLDCTRFHDESRLWSSEITRAFTSAIRAASEGSQSEVSGPDDVSLEPDVAISEVEIVRGVDEDDR